MPQWNIYKTETQRNERERVENGKWFLFFIYMMACHHDVIDSSLSRINLSVPLKALVRAQPLFYVSLCVSFFLIQFNFSPQLFIFHFLKIKWWRSRQKWWNENIWTWCSYSLAIATSLVINCNWERIEANRWTIIPWFLNGEIQFCPSLPQCWMANVKYVDVYERASSWLIHICASSTWGFTRMPFFKIHPSFPRCRYIVCVRKWE